MVSIYCYDDCKLEIITLQGIVYSEDKSLIIIKEKCHICMALLFSQQLMRFGELWCFRKLSAGDWDEMETLLAGNSKICQ